MKEDIKHLYKFFISIFLISFLIVNWNDISWIFNYRVISAQVSDFFQKDKSEQNLKKESYFDKENSIEIPKIGIEAPIIFTESNNEKDFKNALKKGVLLHPDYSLPNEHGRTLIFGHSAPPNWPKINYDDVFSRLDELQKGDEIIIYYRNRKYVYQVYDKNIFYPQNGQNFLSENNKDNSQLVLITCWPPGKDFKRLAILAKPI